MQRHRVLGDGILGWRSAVITARPSVLGALQLIGGLFLIYMGVASIRSGFASRRGSTVVVGTKNYTEQAIAAGSINDLTGWLAYKLGVVTNLSNPKALVFFGAVFAQFIRPDMSLTWTVAVAVILLAMSVTWFLPLLSLCARHRAGLRIIPRPSISFRVLSLRCWDSLWRWRASSSSSVSAGGGFL